MTLFEKIIAGQIPGDIVYEDDWCVALRDIDPKAPVHVLVVPRKPIPKVSDASEADAEILGHCMLATAKVAKAAGLTDYRVVVNNGAAVGQSVFHIHLHVLGGRKMGWPPG